MLREFEIHRADLASVGHYDSPAHTVNQFAHVARPGVRVDSSDSIGRKSSYSPTGVLLETLQYAVRKQPDILAALAQRGFFDLQHAKAVKQICPKTTVDHCRLHIHMSRRDDPYIHGSGSVTTEPFNGALLQEAQQARLTLEWQVSDLIEEQCATVGRLYTADFALVRPGERTAFVAK